MKAQSREIPSRYTKDKNAKKSCRGSLFPTGRDTDEEVVVVSLSNVVEPNFLGLSYVSNLFWHRSFIDQRRFG